MLYTKNAIRIDKYRPPGKNGGPKNQYVFKCRTCPNEIKVKALSRLATATGLCVTCNNRRILPKALAARRIRIYEPLFNGLKDSARTRKVVMDITFKQFLGFTKIHECHYCNSGIVWKKTGSRTYNLDRKDNNGGYLMNNLVVCCARCNKGKREIYTYEEWYGMTEYFRKKA